MKTDPVRMLTTPLRGSSDRAGFEGSPNKAWLAALSAALAIGFAACATAPKVQTESKPGIDFSRCRTFALLPLPTAVPGADPGQVFRLAEPARQAVIESLVAKGYKEVDQAHADVAVNLRGQSMPQVEVTDWGYSRTALTRRGAVPVHVGDVEVHTYQERTVIVEIFDNRTRDLSWTGWSTRKTSGAIDVEKLRQTIGSILAEFPPPKSASSAAK